MRPWYAGQNPCGERVWAQDAELRPSGTPLPRHSHPRDGRPTMSLRKLGEAHERLKHRIHNTRLILPPWALPIAKLLYFSIPIAGGMWLLFVTQDKMRENYEKAAAAAAASQPPVAASPVSR
jgi:hypothetical protein